MLSKRVKTDFARLFSKRLLHRLLKCTIAATPTTVSYPTCEVRLDSFDARWILLYSDTESAVIDFVLLRNKQKLYGAHTGVSHSCRQQW